MRSQAESARAERVLDEADRVLSAFALLAADDLDRRLGSHPVGEFVVDVQRPRRSLYRIAVADGDAPGRMLLVTGCGSPRRRRDETARWSDGRECR
ncbi:MAG: hypothetical protein IPG75_17355 [Gemmatimonadetes bacterium]|nr:hypothetical protein [Gemmatimonadota bacterium]